MRTFYRGILAALAIITIGSAGAILGNRLFLDQPRVHVIQDGEYLSDLAQTYYGDADYWRALALVNRVPDADRIYPGEHIVLPSLGAIQKISATNRFSTVNTIMSEQLTMASLETDEEAAAFAGRSTTGSTLESSAKPEPETASAVASEPETMQEESEPLTPQSNETNSTSATAAPPEITPDSDTEEKAAESGTASSGLFWPVIFIVSTVLFGAVFVLYRRQKNTDDSTPLEAAPVDSDHEQTHNNTAFQPDGKGWNNELELEPISDDDIFRPVSQKNRALKGAYL